MDKKFENMNIRLILLETNLESKVANLEKQFLQRPTETILFALSLSRGVKFVHLNIYTQNFGEKISISSTKFIFIEGTFTKNTLKKKKKNLGAPYEN